MKTFRKENAFKIESGWDTGLKRECLCLLTNICPFIRNSVGFKIKWYHNNDRQEQYKYIQQVDHVYIE